MQNVKRIGAMTAGAAALTAVTPAAFAQPNLDRVLSGASAEEGEHCAVVQVGFNFPVRYLNHFPVAEGDELRIRVRAIDERLNGQSMTQRESVRAPDTLLAEILAIDFDGDRRDGPNLTLVFDRTEHYRVGQGSDFRSIRIAISDGVDEANCTPESHPGGRDEVIELIPAPARAQSVPDVDVGANDPLLAEARAAMTAGDNAHAVQLLTRILEQPESPSSRDAQELLGLARERAGQHAHARAEYEEYLRRWPEGAASERVRQRLAVMLAAELPQPRPELRRAARQQRAGRTQWEGSASFSQLYFRDDLTYSYEDMFAPTPTTTTDQQTNQNELLTALDAQVAVATNSLRARIRASGAYTSDFRPEGEDEGSVSALYLEVGDRDERFVLRAGRQTRSSSGIFGRYDGATVSARPLGRLRVDLSAGYPVDTPRDLTFDPHRFFYAGSIEYEGENWDAGVYRLHQTSYDFVDRDAVGVELRYVGDRTNLFALADYDVHYKELNIGMASGTFTLFGDTTVNLGYDYRKAPMLATINALIGQTAGSLDDLRLTYADDQIEQLALDRTAQSSTVFAGISQPLGERFSFNVDATLSNLEPTPASGGVPATEEVKDELYVSAQLIGTSLFKDGDLGMIGVRYANTSTSLRYGLDINTRYPVTRAFRINPRLRLSYRTNKHDEGTQLAARPSLRMNYQVGRHVSFEFDGGAEWQLNESPVMREESWDYFVMAGYRLDF